MPLRLGHLQDLTASVGGQKASPTRSDQTVIVNLPSALAPGDQLNVTIGYKAFFNTNTSGKKSLFMKKSSIVDLVPLDPVAEPTAEVRYAQLRGELGDGDVATRLGPLHV